MKISIWESFKKKHNFPKLNKNILCDVAIIGGGISGILSAYELSKSFKNIVLLEQNTLISGATLYTTAKVTVQHDNIYQKLLKHYDEKDAYNYYKANLIGLERIKDIVTKEKIDCDAEKVSSFLYSTSVEGYNLLQKELESYHRLGINGHLINDKKLGDKMATFLEIKNMYQFNPVKFLDSLVDILKGKVSFYENTKIINNQNGKLETSDGFTIDAKYVVVASLYPVYKPFNLYFTKLKSSKSFLSSGKIKKEIEDGMYLKVTNPVVTIRKVNKDNMKYYLYGGYTYDSYDYKKVPSYIVSLKEELKEYLDEEFFFDNEDYTSVDLLPFIGKVDDYTFIMCGYGKWGMTNASFASKLVSDLILQKENDLSYLFDPKRKTCNLEKIRYNFKVMKTLVVTKLTIKKKIQSLNNDSGMVCKYRGRVLAIYKDKDGIVELFNGKCPHLKCNLYYNDIEKTFDCPCHGSRFDCKGRLIFGPSRKDLEKLDSKKM